MKLESTYKNSWVVFETITSIEPDKNADIIISDQSSTTKFKTIVELHTESKVTVINLLWSNSANLNSISFKWLEPEETLFIGAGEVSAVIDIHTRKIKQINYPMLFWTWKEVDNFILELTETECRLFTRNGNYIDEVPVDPPYEYELKKNHIEFNSIVMGKHIIKLPS